MNFLAKRRDLLIAKKVPPSTYQQVEYIESTGTQYIDTGIVPNATTKLETVFQYTKTYTSGSHCNGISWDYGRFAFGVVTSLSKKFVYSIAHGNFDSGVTADTKKHTLLMQANGFTRMDGFEYTYPVETMQGDVTIPIFARSDEFSKISGYSDMRLFSYKLYSDDAMVRDYIPCYRKSDNEIGLFDLVNGEFYTNKGTGTFVKGDNI